MDCASAIFVSAGVKAPAENPLKEAAIHEQGVKRIANVRIYQPECKCENAVHLMSEAFHQPGAFLTVDRGNNNTEQKQQAKRRE